MLFQKKKEDNVVGVLFQLAGTLSGAVIVFDSTRNSGQKDFSQTHLRIHKSYENCPLRILYLFVCNVDNLG
jgi:hypothetical protein